MKANAYRTLADFVSWFHLFWVVLLLGGILMMAVFPWYRPIHMIVVTTTIVSQLIWLGNCPLMVLENSLRQQFEPERHYTSSFVQYCAQKWFKIKIPPALIAAQLLIVTILSAIVWIVFLYA